MHLYPSAMSAGVEVLYVICLKLQLLEEDWVHHVCEQVVYVLLPWVGNGQSRNQLLGAWRAAPTLA